jgi:threonine dehydratase
VDSLIWEVIEVGEGNGTTGEPAEESNGARSGKPVHPIGPISLAEVEAAARRIHGIAIRTPLVDLNVEDSPARILLKLENLQPVGSFKIRGAANAMALIDSDELSKGVYTASAGNMAQGVAWNARRLGIPCHVVLPDNAPDTKVEAVERMGGIAIPVPWDVWWQVLLDHHYDGVPGTFIHPVADRAVVAGNGTSGLEILDDCPDVDAIVVPFGGGGQACGIASAVKVLKPGVKVFAAEVKTAAPLAASFEADAPTSIERIPSFVDGIGGKGVLPEMWPLASSLLDGSLVVSLESIVDAIRLLMIRNRVMAEGAGGASVAAALDGLAGEGTVVAVVSGGNLSSAALRAIVEGRIPDAG